MPDDKPPDKFVPRALPDSEYCSMLDSVARNYNSQMTAHVGYLLTSVFAPLAFASLATSAGWIDGLLQWLSEFSCVHALFPWEQRALLLVGLGLVYVLFPVSMRPYVPHPFSPLYLFARMYYYYELSQIVWDHMGINSPSKIRFDELKMRAFKVWDLDSEEFGIRTSDSKRENRWHSMGISGAIKTCFEARLYLTLRSTKKSREEEISEPWVNLFFFRRLYAAKMDVDGFGQGRIKFLLLIAYGKNLESYVHSSGEYEQAVGRLFKPFFWS